ncbi:MAG: nucleotidyltransferase family protein [Gemmatimonadales bacterium]
MRDEVPDVVRAPADRPRIEEALRLRRWALRVLASRSPDPPAGTAATWRLFLQAERCALPVKTALRHQQRWEQLPVQARESLDAFATRELQEVLSARATLAAVDRLAADLSVEVVVLKGGVAACSDARAVALADIDLLVRPSEAERFAGALDDAGYSAHGAGSVLHLSKRVARETLPVEVHRTLDETDEEWVGAVWERTRPLECTETLRRLGARDHTWHLLTHVVVQHPFRAGAIRDLHIIAGALAECDPAELASLRDATDQRPESETFRDVLTLAQEFSGEQEPEDRFRRRAAAAYAFHEYGGRLPGPTIFKSDVATSTFAMLQGPSAYGRWYRRVMWRRVAGRSRFPPIAWLEARSRRVGRMARVASRAVRLAVAAPLALVLTVASRRYGAAGERAVGLGED